MDLAPAKGTTPQRRPEFEYEGFNALFDYWNSLRGGVSVPGTRDFDLLHLTSLLPDLVVSEFHSELDIRHRFVGPAVVERFGYDPTGKNSLLNQSDNMRPQIGRYYGEVVNRPCAAFARFTNLYSSGRESVAEGLYLPLHSRTARWFVNLNRVVSFSDWLDEYPQTLTAARILDLEWIDIGFGRPTTPASD